MVYDGIARTKNQGTPSCLSFRPPSSPWLKSRSSDRFRSEAIVRQKWYEKGAMARILRVRLDSRPNTGTASLNGTRSFLPVPSLLLLLLLENLSFPPTLFLLDHHQSLYIGGFSPPHRFIRKLSLPTADSAFRLTARILSFPRWWRPTCRCHPMWSTVNVHLIFSNLSHPHIDSQKCGFS